MLTFRMIGGQFDGVAMNMAAPYTPNRIWLVESPDPQLPAMLVGTDRMPPSPVFIGAREYTLDRDASNLRDHPLYEGMEDGRAVYRSA